MSNQAIGMIETRGYVPALAWKGNVDRHLAKNVYFNHTFNLYQVERGGS